MVLALEPLLRSLLFVGALRQMKMAELALPQLSLSPLSIATQFCPCECIASVHSLLVDRRCQPISSLSNSASIAASTSRLRRQILASFILLSKNRKTSRRRSIRHRPIWAIEPKPTRVELSPVSSLRRSHPACWRPYSSKFTAHPIIPANFDDPISASRVWVSAANLNIGVANCYSVLSDDLGPRQWRQPDDLVELRIQAAPCVLASGPWSLAFLRRPISRVLRFCKDGLNQRDPWWRLKWLLAQPSPYSSAE